MFIVVYDDQCGVCVPFGLDDSCEGAIESNSCGPVALFATRAEARKAVNISTAAAKLAIAQGKPANTDFTDGRHNVKVIPVKWYGTGPEPAAK